MYARKVLHDSVQRGVEQALAWGHTVGWICDRYGITDADVQAVIAYLERVNGEPDSDVRGYRAGGAA